MSLPDKRLFSPRGSSRLPGSRATRALLEAATRIGIELDHPAYDCLYLALAVENQCRFVTADERFLGQLRQTRGRFRNRIIALNRNRQRNRLRRSKKTRARVTGIKHMPVRSEQNAVAAASGRK